MRGSGGWGRWSGGREMTKKAARVDLYTVPQTDSASQKRRSHDGGRQWLVTCSPARETGWGERYSGGGGATIASCSAGVAYMRRG